MVIISIKENTSNFFLEKNKVISTDYTTDFYAWTQQQAELLRNRAINDLDWENIAEEIKGMGCSEKRPLKSRLKY